MFAVCSNPSDGAELVLLAITKLATASKTMNESTTGSTKSKVYHLRDSAAHKHVECVRIQVLRAPTLAQPTGRATATHCHVAIRRTTDTQSEPLQLHTPRRSG
jgi:hypothetical protein